MGRILLVARLAVRDLRRRPIEAALLLLAMMAATTTLTLGLVLHDAASDPYLRTREATNGPDVVASVAPTPVSGPTIPPTWCSTSPPTCPASRTWPTLPASSSTAGRTRSHRQSLQASGRTSDVQAMGRDAAPVSVDQPELTQGSWVSDGGVVVEAAFAHALDVRVGDQVTLDGRSFDVVGVAVTAAMPPYPESSAVSRRMRERCDARRAVRTSSGTVAGTRSGLAHRGGCAEPHADPESLSYVMNLKLADPDSAQAFVDAHLAESLAAPRLESWEDILEEATERARDAQILLMIGAWLLGLLAVASVSVLVGGRMADQTRRVGLLKAVGGTPSLVAAVLLAEYVLVAIVAAAAGLAVGSLSAPLLTESGAGLVGGARTPSITLSTVGLVIAMALGVAVAATAVPAMRAARTSTVHALADAARPPRRTGWLIASRRDCPSRCSSPCGWPPAGRATSCWVWSASRSRSAGSSSHWCSTPSSPPNHSPGAWTTLRLSS